MDKYDLKPEKKKRRSPLWNILTVLVLLAACGLLYLFIQVFMNPNMPLNPFPPVPLPTKFHTPTPTYTVKPLEPTWTFTPSIQPSPSRTKAPTWTLLPELITPEFTNTATVDLNTPTISPTPMPATAEVSYIPSTDAHPTDECNWTGVGGKVVDSEGNQSQKTIFQTVQLSGTLGGKPVNKMVLSGHDSFSPYGASGFEFKLGDVPVDSTQELWIMLFDNTGQPLTDKIYLDLYSQCDKNLTFVTFTKNR